MSCDREERIKRLEKKVCTMEKRMGENMYQSPIEITRTVDDIVTKINEKQDEAIVHACMRVGVNVDKDELVKALAYDRGQYEKGYADGRLARDSEIVRCKDCKHRPTGTGANHDLEFPDNECPCQCEDYWYSWIPQDNWFCADGERKEGDADGRGDRV